MKILIASILSFIVGVSGTMSGGAAVLAGSKRYTPHHQGWLLGFSGGIMVTVVLFDLWPEAIHFGGFLTTIFGTIIGMALVQYADAILQLVPWYTKRHFSKFTRVGILLGLGIGVHNFPEGVALGTTYIADPFSNTWISLALLMAIHNIPEGMVVAAALKIGNISHLKIMIGLILVELPMALGGTAGAILGTISPVMVSVSLGFAGGAMILLVLKELIPMAKKIAGIFWVGAGFAIGSLLGIVLVRII